MIERCGSIRDWLKKGKKRNAFRDRVTIKRGKTQAGNVPGERFLGYISRSKEKRGEGKTSKMVHSLGGGRDERCRIYLTGQSIKS